MDSLSPATPYERGFQAGKDAILELLSSDECYYAVAGAKESWWSAITEAAQWAEKKIREDRAF
jgi:hypothetical protein